MIILVRCRMIKRLAKILSVVIALGMSFFLGTKVGMNQYVLAMSSGNAFNISRKLRLIRNGEIHTVECDMEQELNLEMNLYNQYKESGSTFLLWPYLHEINHEQYMSKVIEYKEKYPQDLCLQK